MIYSRNFIQTVKSRIDLLELVSHYTTMKKVGDGIYSGKCPHPNHNDDTPSFVVYNKKLDDQNWCCYGCHCDKKNSEQESKFLLNKNFGSDCFAFIQWITNYDGTEKAFSFTDAVEYLANYANIPLEEDKFKIQYKILKNIALAHHKDLYTNTEALQYLYSRGLNDSDIAYYLIGYNKENNRISFPLPNTESNIVGFSDRIMPGKIGVKYINSETSGWFHKSKYFYGISNFNKNEKYAIITEGTFDVILAQKYGVKNVLAPLGTSFTEYHASILSNMKVTPIFCQDNDEAGLKAIMKTVNLMAECGINSKVCLLEPGMDLAEMALKYKNRLTDYINDNSVFFGYYCLNTMFENFDKELYSVRMKYLPNAMDLIQKVPDKNEQELLKYELYKKMGGKSFGDML